MAESTVEKLERQYEQAKARLQAAKARERTKSRKLEARRKIILGGALIERAERDPAAAEMLAGLITGLSRAQDRKTFEGWQAPCPAPDPLPAHKPVPDAQTKTASKAAPEPPSGPPDEDQGTLL
ncbi:mobilization protein [Primorskyibacter flagellatus]|uniref:Mobilization protein n=1 Tax=Primorskyibacter flagellatus TaxID=1387277 RepID=A0A1W2ELL0_9RHOB|nr:mobilization protein [Primorskyibacter flagellatus]SMD10631.1 hypothetical protein SAMN06295998_1335 [Primorskyibacter flagellatus]